MVWSEIGRKFAAERAPSFLGEEDKEGTVQAVKRELMGEELGDDIVNIREDEVPVGHKEAGAEAIWTGTGICIHTVEGAANLRC